MGGIFGALSGRPRPDRRQSKVYESDDGASRRKRGSVYDDDASKRLRRDDRKVGRSRKISDADGFTDAAPVTEAETPEAKEARRAERRARREREVAEDEARAARRREKDDARKAKAREERDRLVKEDEEREARKQEERRARRAEREARHAEEDRLAREEQAKTAERRERRREREKDRVVEEATSRPKSDRRRSYMDQPDDDETRRVRREERRPRRTVEVSAGDKERPRTSRRRSDYPAPVDDYFDRRNGEHSPNKKGGVSSPLADGRLKASGGNDKTASWVNSINDDPPPPPPVEGTIIDAPAHFAEDHAPDAPLDESTAREMRHKRRKDKDGYVDDDSERPRRRRDGDAQKSSDGSSHNRRKSHGGVPVNSMGYNEMGAKTWDGRPAMSPKRGSWLKKMTGF